MREHCKNAIYQSLIFKHNHTINLSSVCLFVCVFPISSEGPLTDLRQTWWLYVGGPPICPWGVLFRKGQRVTFTFHYIIYAPASRHTAAKGAFCFAVAAAESNSAPFAALHLNGVCRWTSQLPLRGSFSKRSTGRRVNRSNGSMGQWVTFTLLYDSRRHQAHATPLQKAHSVFCSLDG